MTTLREGGVTFAASTGHGTKCDRRHRVRHCPCEPAQESTNAAERWRIALSLAAGMGSAGVVGETNMAIFVANTPVNMETLSDLDILTSASTNWTNVVSSFTATSSDGFVEIVGSGGPFAPLFGDPTSGP